MEVSGWTFLAATAAVVASRQGQWWMKNLAILLVTKSGGKDEASLRQRSSTCSVACWLR